MTVHARVRTSQSLVSIPRDRRVLFYNFLTQKAVMCSTDVLYWIASFADWETMESVEARHPHLDSTSLRAELSKLAQSSILIAEGSAEHRTECEFNEHWEWGLATGMYHFSLLNNVFASSAEGTKRQLDRAATNPSPPLYRTHGDGAIKLEQPHSERVKSLVTTMKARRSNRVPGEPSIELEQLSDCLYAGMAITGEVKTATGRLPLQMTPAGGARNAFEAYVLVNWVEGLEPGIYHYSATEHSLSLVNSELPERSGALLAEQDWVHDKPAIVFLVGYLERVMWKYQDPNGYRVVLIEAGHKGQNIALAATAHGLSACPTAAMNHDLVAQYLKLDRITHTPIYALTLSKPGLYDFEIFGIGSDSATKCARL